MNNVIELRTRTDIVLDEIELAKRALRRLANAGVAVFALTANGRRPVLYIDAPPPGVQGVSKRQSPNGIGGTTVLYAAPFDGCQLEWMRDYPAQAPAPTEIADVR